MSILQRSDSRRFTPTGLETLMVTKQSAERISNQVRVLDHLPSESDHRGLVRFDHAHDSKYISLVESIKFIAVPSEHFSGGISYNISELVKHFVPQADLEYQIKRQLHDSITVRQHSAKVLVVYGLGRAGKSQLVLGYVRAFR